MILMEVCWNTYPSTGWSSSLLLLLHVLMLIGVWPKSLHRMSGRTGFDAKLGEKLT
jgi:hypothetical protein